MKKNKKAAPGAKKKSVKRPAQSAEKEGRLGAFPIVGIGASAGGLEAFEEFFRHLSPDCGMAFVLVPHLDPGHESILTQILQRVTTMTVVEATDQAEVAVNHVYIIPPNREMSIFHGALQLSVPPEPRGLRLPIDHFFRSLAEDQGENSVCIILSGTGTDGTLGLRAINGAGGVSFVQDPASAKYDGMPTSAIRSRLATYVMNVENIPKQLEMYINTRFGRNVGPVPSAPVITGTVNKILLLLRTRTGNDFSLYKKSTIYRRLERRMLAHDIESKESYLRYIQENTDETHELFKELLINVTSFFRDPEAFDALKSDIFPKLFRGKSEDNVIRIWVPGCATGEEAYSIAIMCREYMDEIKLNSKIQIYATDVDNEAVASARAGNYMTNISADVSPERLRKFFVKEPSGYRIKKDIREMVIFATQNIIKDPPFTKLDLISCRNLLIYFEPELQERVIPMFLYALKPGGALFLGSSESTGKHSDLFKTLNRKWKIFTSNETGGIVRGALAQRSFSDAARVINKPIKAATKTTDRVDYIELIKKALFHAYVPPSVIINESWSILYVYGDTGKFLQPAHGQATLNIIDMAREDLQADLRIALRDAATKKARVAYKGLRVRSDGVVHGLDLVVKPITDPDAPGGMLIVTFQDAPLPKPEKLRRPVKQSESKQVRALQKELLRAKNILRVTIEDQQVSNEEIKSTSEELQSTNEELQSTNEEMETSKEELQSINEELVTVNSELQAKIELLTTAQNDMKNFFESTGIGVLFLDTKLTIRRFNREATRIFNIIATDSDRFIGDITSSIPGIDWVGQARKVLETLVPKEETVDSPSGIVYLARILPYRTLDNVIDGVVLVFTDITDRKKAENVADETRVYAENIINTVREPLVVLDGELKVVSASRSFYKEFRTAAQDTIGRRVYDLGNRQWDIPKLRELLETILPQNASFDDFEVEHEFPEIGRKKMLLNARRVTGVAGTIRFILLAFELKG